MRKLLDLNFALSVVPSEAEGSIKFRREAASIVLHFTLCTLHFQSDLKFHTDPFGKAGGHIRTFAPCDIYKYPQLGAGI